MEMNIESNRYTQIAVTFNALINIMNTTPLAYVRIFSMQHKIEFKANIIFINNNKAEAIEGQFDK